MREIKYLLLLLVFLLLAPSNISAQDYYHFIYIEHEIGNHKNVLCEKLKSFREDAKEMGDILIIYLSTGDQEQGYGLCSYTNIEDPSGKNQDTEEAFNSIIAVIQDSKSLPVNAMADVQNVREMMDASNFVDENGNMKYSKAEIDFYVGSRFWRLGFFNSVIAHLYSVLDVPSMPKNKLGFRVFVPRSDDKFSYPDGMPFGENNIDRINENIKLQKY